MIITHEYFKWINTLTTYSFYNPVSSKNQNKRKRKDCLAKGTFKKVNCNSYQKV